MSDKKIHPDFAPEAVSYLAEGPQPLLREMAEPQPYPVEALGPLAEVVKAVTDITQAPVGIAAQSALTVASLHVQGFANIETLGGTAPLSIFALTIAESGERKSTCDKLLMKPIADHEARAEEAYQRDFADHAIALERWELMRKRIIADTTSSDKLKSTAAAADLRALGPRPRPPLCPGRTAQDPTFEGLLKFYQVGSPSLGIFSDEAAGFIGGHAMNSDNRIKTSAGLCKLWDGNPVNRMRAGDGFSQFPGRRFSLHLMAQSAVAIRLISDPEARRQGIIARFLIHQPASTIGHRLRRGHDPRSDQTLRAYYDRAAHILETPMPTDQDPQVLTPKLLALSDAARDFLWDFYRETEAAQGKGGEFEHMRAEASKICEQAARIAGVMTMWSDLNAEEVEGNTMADAIILARFYLGEAKRLSELGAISAETAKAEDLRLWLEGWPYDDITPSEILQNGPNGLRERKAVNGPLGMLVNSGHLQRLPDQSHIRGKPRKEAYLIIRKK